MSAPISQYAIKVFVAGTLVSFAFPAAAHGQEVLLMPVGNCLALALVGVVTLVLRIGWWARASAVALTVAAALPLYFARGLPYWLRSSEAFWFAAGLVPPVVVAGLFLWKNARRRTSAVA